MPSLCSELGERCQDALKIIEVPDVENYEDQDDLKNAEKQAVVKMMKWHNLFSRIMKVFYRRAIPCQMHTTLTFQKFLETF